jgi:transcriptional regulator with XRE-family HTH domain
MMTPEQIRMARAALDWSELDVAKNTKLSSAAISALEHGKDTRVSIVSGMQVAFEKEGVVFGADGSVRLIVKRTHF